MKKTLITILSGAFIFMFSAQVLAVKHQKTLTLEGITESVDRLIREQSIMSWNNTTKGTPVDFESTYKGYEWLFTPESIAFVDKSINEENIPDDEKLARSFLKDFLVTQYVELATAPYDDRFTNAESEAKVKPSWQEKTVAYREIPILISQEDNPQRRKELQKLAAEVQIEKLNPILQEKDAMAHRLIKELGYKSYLDYSLAARHVKDFRKIIKDADAFNKRTEAIYKKLLSEFAEELLKMKVSDMRRSDLQKLFRFDPYVAYFPPEVMIPFLKHFLAQMGLDLTTADGKNIRLDDEKRPRKNPRAACFNITVPSDIRMTIAPSGGIGDFSALFHETGHAVHFANTTVNEWAFKYLGDYSATESYAGLLESLLAGPDFLKSYREFVKEWNAGKHTGKQPGKPVPVMTDKDIAKVVRFGILNDLYFMRRYGGAKLIYESIYHEGAPGLWAGIYKGGTSDKREVYRVLFEKAYSFPMEDVDSARYLTDIDEFLYAIDYVRSFVAISQIDESLAKLFGNKWYENKDSGKYLKQKLFLVGDKLTADEVVSMLGYGGIDFKVHEKNIRKKLAESEKLLASN